ncbi:MAG: YibE/F family protein [Cetobacterium sp.]|uniref:YibE/F family protein n=1 Tax=Cetobacterium sp. TaxID=2071632 RepID=UPI003F34174D
MKRLLLALITILCIYGGSSILEHSNYERNEFKSKVISVDNSGVITAGVSNLGEQKLVVKIKNGPHKNKEIEVHNFLSGALEYDEFYKAKDKILVGVFERGGQLRGKALSLYRFDSILVLISILSTALIIYAGAVGIKSIISFLASLFVVWKILIPNLNGDSNVFFLTILILLILSAIIIFLVAGFTKKGLAAFLGTLFGFFITTLLTFMFGDMMRLDGMNQPFAQGILLTTNLGVNLLEIFYITIALGASGAAMDIAMDMAATVEEVHKNAPHLSKKDLIKSGFNVGKVVIGTMTTTLLLAYSGGYLTLLMMFLQRNVSISTILNIKIVSAEVVKILIGSISLVVVAPLTAIISAYIYKREKTGKNIS